MHHPARRWTATTCALLALAACTTNPAPSAPTPAAVPSPTGVASEPLTFRYLHSQLKEAVPDRYRGVALDLTSYPFNPNRTYTPRPDPLAGRSIEPESCRPLLRGEAWPSGQYGGLPSETPSGYGSAYLGDPVAGVEPYISASIVEVTGDKATRFLEVLPKTGPECANVRIVGGSTASVVERSLPEFGPESRYIVRSYPLGGRQWVDRVLLSRSQYYVTEVRFFGAEDSEAAFLTFARQVRDRAAQRLK